MYTYCTTQTCCALHAYCSSFPHRDARRALQPNGVKGRPFTSCVIFWFDFFLFSFCAHRGNAFETWGSAPHPAPGGELFLYFLSWPPPLRVLRVLAESSPNPRRVLAKSSPSPHPSPSPLSTRRILLAESSPSPPSPRRILLAESSSSGVLRVLTNSSPNPPSAHRIILTSSSPSHPPPM